MAGLADEFNENNYTVAKVNGFVLNVRYPYSPNSSYETHLNFDFMARVLTVRTGDSAGGTSTVPFSQLDRVALDRLRDKLIDLGGHPPELGPETPVTSAPQKKLNL